jgi:acylphosphatase
MSDRPAVRLLVSGRVQGVGYRYWVVGEAQRLGLEGWVRNCADGMVEILAIGPAEALSQLAATCRRGPSSARVVAVARGAAPDDGSRDFTQKPNSVAADAVRSAET